VSVDAYVRQNRRLLRGVDVFAWLSFCSFNGLLFLCAAFGVQTGQGGVFALFLVNFFLSAFSFIWILARMIAGYASRAGRMRVVDPLTKPNVWAAMAPMYVMAGIGGLAAVATKLVQH
jgi:hypothetical protein